MKTMMKTTTMTKTNRSWAWILCHQQGPRHDTDYFQEFDGAYLAACPACGQDCYWNAYDATPMCECNDQ